MANSKSPAARSAKQAHFVRYIAANPGTNTMQLHRAIGRFYAHGSHKFTYETVDRLLRRGVVVRCPSSNGRGTGLTLPA